MPYLHLDLPGTYPHRGETRIGKLDAYGQPLLRMTFDVRENERKMSVYAGVFGLFNFAAVVAEMKGANLSSPRLCAATMIATQLVGSFLVITNVAGLTWLGAGILGVFTLLGIPYGHPFWRFEEPKRSEELCIAFEHVALTGGLLLAAVASR